MCGIITMDVVFDCEYVTFKFSREKSIQKVRTKTELDALNEYLEI